MSHSGGRQLRPHPPPPLQFLAGRFDPLDNQPYTRIPFEAIDADEHRALAFDAALQGMVLLRNDDALLPLTPGVQAIAVIGPLGNLSGALTVRGVRRVFVGRSWCSCALPRRGAEWHAGVTHTAPCPAAFTASP